MRDISMYKNVLIYTGVSNYKQIMLMKNLGLVYQGYLMPYQITKKQSTDRTKQFSILFMSQYNSLLNQTLFHNSGSLVCIKMFYLPWCL